MNKRLEQYATGATNQMQHTKEQVHAHHTCFGTKRISEKASAKKDNERVNTTDERI
jgi:hypothetical protein